MNMLWTAMVLGFAGSLHCAGMCGPLVLAMSSSPSKSRFLLGRFSYNAGRILTYALLGMLFGFIGEGLRLTGAQQLVSILSGALIILVSLSTAGKNRMFNTPILAKGVQKVKSGLGKYLTHQSIRSQFTFGLLNGLLPCGLTYFALVASLGQESIAHSALYMAVFGAGTLPMMLGIALSGQLLKNRFSFLSSAKTTMALGIFLGGLFIVRGLGLGIPYLSPEFEQTGKSVEVSCHKD